MRNSARTATYTVLALALAAVAGPALSTPAHGRTEPARPAGATHDGPSRSDRPNREAAHPEPRLIRLRTRTFDPTTPEAERTRPRGQLRSVNGQAYLVQFTTVLLDGHRAELAALGARIGAYIPDAAYVVRMDAAARERVAALPYVRWVGRYDAGDRVEGGTVPSGTRRYVITLLEGSATDQREVVERITAVGGSVHVASDSLRLVEATLEPAQVLAVAHLDAVLALDLWTPPEADMNNARAAGGANEVEAALGYLGQGVRGEVMDTGLRTTHQEFAAFPPIMHTANTTSTSHGTSTYGQIFASGVNATARGLLPQSQPIFAAYSLVSDRWAHTAQLVDPAGPYRAVFQSNSWGSALTFGYNSTSAAMDDIVFDHDILVCQTQGNTGNRSGRPQAWAKNVVSVGGVYHYDTLSRTDDAWNGGAGIGPAADGRLKPDLSNYYDAVHTTASGGDAAYTGTFSGTSASTPITCGYAGLVHQMWADGVFDGSPGQDRDVFASRPHAATAKALLINSADQYAFTGESHDLARVKQGWGTAGVANLYQQALGNNWRLPILVDETDVLTQGQTATYTMTTDGSQPLKATLVYTDPMGSPSAAQARVNDLSLKLTAPDGTVYWGNNGLAAGNWSTAGGSANTIDTVENVFVQAPAAGVWTIEVIAGEVNADGHVETPVTDADFALVATGKVTG
ncbi:S8 family serine peptidase [Streptomyces sp. PKU-MA01144]|uniref:S8 family serine peptidase n=1 Tax=Streptomyces sp. PKU-MA01144 TaxID=2729138 RepID=UPI00147F8F32|nr:S8 family serine peptidase [Streptomyces sp. PKU-MA01144]NNJ03429.1 S8 family serine peptidase [Streptomyces sp. PKU-MA01144]